ncbi:hypothetical protein EJ08DRAFT_595616 [Tothia fuscella]|uniref:Glycosyltransferase family 8 protein n=1 Tax=Tothia fuscella TaxID=1048955 RepID=A0A9P4NJZ7_9PEZI|nr:hypothetical protein EJ08DRAFT_595616 [Tothia fuscella]
MVLLTSSQVSVVLSSGIVVIFTFLLFLSGYILQQKSIQSLHTQIRPQDPIQRHKPPLVEHTPDIRHQTPKRRFGNLQDRIIIQAQLSAKEEAFDWSRLAYAQLVRDHSEVCNALIFFADLKRLRSPVPRLLLFPRNWVEGSDADVLNTALETSKRLLRKASRRYRVILVPVDAVGEQDGSDPSHYSLASIFSLAQYDRVLSFPSPGLVLNSAPLDSILAFSEPSSVAFYPALNTSVALSSLLLVKPSTSIFKALSHIRASNNIPDTHLLSNFFHSAPPLLEVGEKKLYTTAEQLRTAKTFNGTAFLTDTAFLYFHDSEVPGPEFEVPYSDTVKRRPKDDDQGFLWEKMYATYKDRRYNVCGMDLETWPPPYKQEKQHIEKKVTVKKTDL